MLYLFATFMLWFFYKNSDQNATTIKKAYIQIKKEFNKGISDQIIHLKN